MDLASNTFGDLNFSSLLSDVGTLSQSATSVMNSLSGTPPVTANSPAMGTKTTAPAAAATGFNWKKWGLIAAAVILPFGFLLLFLRHKGK